MNFLEVSVLRQSVSKRLGQAAQGLPSCHQPSRPHRAAAPAPAKLQFCLHSPRQALAVASVSQLCKVLANEILIFFFLLRSKIAGVATIDSQGEKVEKEQEVQAHRVSKHGCLTAPVPLFLPGARTEPEARTGGVHGVSGRQVTCCVAGASRGLHHSSRKERLPLLST